MFRKRVYLEIKTKIKKCNIECMVHEKKVVFLTSSHHEYTKVKIVLPFLGLKPIEGHI